MLSAKTKIEQNEKYIERVYDNVFDTDMMLWDYSIG